MRVMQNNHVSVNLLDEDERVFESVLSGCPLPRRVAAKELDCTILYSDAPLLNFVPSPDLIHTTIITGAQIWYDPVLRVKDLVVTLDAPTLLARRMEIMEQYGVKSLYGDFFPHMTLAYNVPDFNSSYKWWINSILNEFNDRYKNMPLRFTMERVESTGLGFDSSGEVKTDDAQVTQNIIGN